VEDIFEGLNTIHWSELSHAYGTADDVPGLLRALVSEVDDERQEALFQLMGNVWHQGTVYEASSLVVPFLAKMLCSPEVPDHSIIAMLLASIADGHSYLEVHVSPSAIDRETWQQVLAAQGKVLDEQAELEQKWVNAVRDAVDPYLCLLYEFIDHEEPELRYAVALALGNYPNHSDESLGILRTATTIETEEYIREAMEESIVRLQGQKGQK
jgi:hypothetical protein